MRALVYVFLLVDDYDKVIDFYCHRLGLFHVERDTDMIDGGRLVYLTYIDPAFPFAIHLEKPRDESSRQLIGRQAGRGCYFVSLPISDADSMLSRLTQEGIETDGGIHELVNGRQTAIRDCLGNRLSLYQVRPYEET